MFHMKTNAEKLIEQIKSLKKAAKTKEIAKVFFQIINTN